MNTPLALVLRSTATILVALLLHANAFAQMVRMEGLQDGGFTWSRTWMDVDGDGRDDFCALAGSEATRLDCYLSDGTNFVPRAPFLNIGSGQDPRSVRWADVNGDGKADLCRMTLFGTGTSQVSVVCWLGPTYTATTTPLILARRWTEIVGSGDMSYGVEHPGMSADLRDAFFGDVDGDGRSDMCYLYWNVAAPLDLRCHLSAVQGASGGFDTVNPRIKVGIDGGLVDLPRGFYDFNGDGFADYCRISTNTVTCTLSGPNGFAPAEATSSGVPVPYQEGTAFVDMNGDGKTDLCRVLRAANIVDFQLSCKVSNGVNWEGVERTSPVISHTEIGDAGSRSWVDINADGLPDLCRLVGSATTPGDWDLACRLSRGDGDGDSVHAFGFTDVKAKSVELGEVDGRSYCDPTGSGVQTFCRLAVNQVGTAEYCFFGESDQSCRGIPINSTSIVAGLVKLESVDSKLLQARAPLLTSYSDGSGSETRITYLPMTRREVYVKSGDGTYPRALIVLPRSPIVYETRAWYSDDSGPLTGIARYMFKDLLQDTWGGSRGFRERWIFTEGSNTLDHVIHYQGLGPAVDPSSIENDAGEIGLVKYQERFAVVNGLLPDAESTSATPSARTLLMKRVANALKMFPGPIQPVAPSASSPFMLLQSTANTLATLQNAETKGRPYRYIGASEVRSYDWNGTQPVALPTVNTSTELVGHGNVGLLTQTTTALDGTTTWTKTTTNTYGKENEAAWILGRLTKASVVSTAPTADAQLAANGTRSAGNSPNASDMSSSLAAAPQPISPAVLAVILQLLLED